MTGSQWVGLALLAPASISTIWWILYDNAHPQPVRDLAASLGFSVALWVSVALLVERVTL